MSEKHITMTILSIDWHHIFKTITIYTYCTPCQVMPHGFLANWLIVMKEREGETEKSLRKSSRLLYHPSLNFSCFPAYFDERSNSNLMAVMFVRVAKCVCMRKSDKDIFFVKESNTSQQHDHYSDFYVS